MSERKRYTAQEMREASDGLVLSSHAIKDGKIRYDYDNLKSMLRYAAEVVERCEKMIRPCRLEDAPCVPGDDGYCDSCDVPTHNEPFNYILRGEGGAEDFQTTITIKGKNENEEKYNV